MKKILVPIDGSENSLKALNKAKEIAELSQGCLTILHVTPIPATYLTGYEVRTPSPNLEPGKALLQAALKDISDFEGKIETIQLIGDAPSEIIKLAEKDDYDLIVMGRRGLGTFSRAILGSVSNKVVNHVKKSVLIVK